jgi:hypothetical protein
MTEAEVTSTLNAIWLGTIVITLPFIVYGGRKINKGISIIDAFGMLCAACMPLVNIIFAVWLNFDNFDSFLSKQRWVPKDE